MNLTFDNVDALCSKINLSTNPSEIDFRQVTFLEPYALVYLGMLLRHYNAQGHSFNLIPPRSVEARTYLARQKFWERFNFNPAVVRSESVRRFTTSTSLNDIVDIQNSPNIADTIGLAVRDLLIRCSVKVQIGTVVEVVSELVDNFARHSGDQLAACAVQYYPNLRKLAFSIGDCGIGIRSSLSDNPKYQGYSQRPHHDAALKAFEPSVTGGREGGMGLTIVREEVLALGGTVRLATGDAYVTMSDSAEYYGFQAFNLPGVQIEVKIQEGT